MCVLRHVWLFVTTWTVACQAPLSMGFSRQKYWSGFPFPTPGDLPDPGIKPRSLCLLHWREDSLPLAPSLYAGVLMLQPRLLQVWTLANFLPVFTLIVCSTTCFFLRSKALWPYWPVQRPLRRLNREETFLWLEDDSVFHVWHHVLREWIRLGSQKGPSPWKKFISVPSVSIFF